MGKCFAFTAADNISATAVCSGNYPEKAAFMMLAKLIHEFRQKFEAILKSPITKDEKWKYPELDEYLKTWQNPAQADKLLAVEKNLMDVHEVMRANLE